MTKREPAEYVALGRLAIVELLEVHHAASWLEVEARVADEECPGLGTPVNPHHLSDARRQLLGRGVVTELTATSRGGRRVPVVALTKKASATVVQRAAARKRLLLARYFGWAQGTPSRPGIIGPAAEQVTHASLIEAAPYGYRLANPTGRGVAEFLGVRLRGPLDNAAILTPLDADGLPTTTVAVPIEVIDRHQRLGQVDRGSAHPDAARVRPRSLRAMGFHSAEPCVVGPRLDRRGRDVGPQAKHLRHDAATRRAR